MYILKALCLFCSTSVSEGTAGISRGTLNPARRLKTQEDCTEREAEMEDMCARVQIFFRSKGKKLKKEKKEHLCFHSRLRFRVIFLSSFQTRFLH